MNADFLSGSAMAVALVIALVFFRYWRQTGDRLFVMFAAGFLVFGVSRLILAFLDDENEGEVFVYGFRLLAFLLILAAIIDKNRTQPEPPLPPPHDGREDRTRAGRRPFLTRDHG